MDFPFSVPKYGAGYDVVGVRKAWTPIVKAKFFGFLMVMIFFYEGAVASWDQEFDERAEKAP